MNTEVVLIGILLIITFLMFLRISAFRHGYRSGYTDGKVDAEKDYEKVIEEINERIVSKNDFYR